MKRIGRVNCWHTLFAFAAACLSWQVSAASPDLTAPTGHIVTPQPAIEGQPVTYQVTIQNDGNATAVASRARSFISPGDDFDSWDDVAFGTPVNVPSLRSGASAQISFTGPMPNLKNGSYSIWFLVDIDYEDVVPESGEGNLWKKTDGVAVIESAVLTLQNGQAVSNLGGIRGSERVYKITVPQGQSRLQISISGGTGDCDLYVKRGSIPTLSSYDYSPYLYDNNETVTVNNPAPGDWYVMLRSYSYSGVTLLAKYEEQQIQTLQNNSQTVAISDVTGGQQLYKINVSAGQTRLELSISGGTGDCDLYVKRGSVPTLSNYEYRLYKNGNNETVTVTNPASGDWYVMLHSYSAYSGVTLLAKYEATIDAAALVSETVPSGAIMSPGQVFTKTWTLRNTGTSTWTPGNSYTLNLVPGSDRMGAANASLFFANPIAPNGEVTFSVTLTAPTTPGTYTGLWRMNSAAAIDFGPAVPVRIEVRAGSKAEMTTPTPGSTLTSSSTTFEWTSGSGVAEYYIMVGRTKNGYDIYNQSQGLRLSGTISNLPTDGNTVYLTLWSRFGGEWKNNDYTFVASTSASPLSNNTPVEWAFDTTTAQKLYTFSVPHDITTDILKGPYSLEFRLERVGGAGPCDIYVKKGSAPTTSSYDFRVYGTGATKSVLLDIDGMRYNSGGQYHENIPRAVSGGDDWYILLHGQTAVLVTTVEITARYDQLTLQRHPSQSSSGLSNRKTWVLIHGRNDSRDSLVETARVLENESTDDQVVTLDWSSGAASPGLFNQENGRFMEAIAKKAKSLLGTKGLVSGSSLNIVGHSWGTYVGDWLKRKFGSINHFIALDPANTISISADYRGTINFGQSSSRSWSFLAYQGLAGSDTLAKTAADAVSVSFAPLSSFVYDDSIHRGVRELFEQILKENYDPRFAPTDEASKLFGLDVVYGATYPVWTRDRISQSGEIRPTSGTMQGDYTYEAHLRCAMTSDSDQRFSSITSLTYVNKSGQRQDVSP